MNLTTRVLAATAASATLAGLLVAPAAAERGAYADPADMGGASLNDLRMVTVDHGSIRTTVRVRVTDLRRHSEAGPAGLTLRLDTRRDVPGPEYRLTTGLYDGTDYQLMKVEDHRVVGQPMTCDHRVHLGFVRDVVRFRAANRCLVTPHRIRVSVKMTDEFDGSHPVTDWLGAPRSWTDWLRAH
jgi:hypothetical protein